MKSTLKDLRQHSKKWAECTHLKSEWETRETERNGKEKQAGA